MPSSSLRFLIWRREAGGEASASTSGASACFRAAGGVGLPRPSDSALAGEEWQVGEEASSVCPKAGQKLFSCLRC